MAEATLYVKQGRKYHPASPAQIVAEATVLLTPTNPEIAKMMIELFAGKALAADDDKNLQKGLTSNALQHEHPRLPTTETLP